MGDTEKRNLDSSDSEHEDENCPVTKAINRVLDDWFVTGFSRFAAKRFIQKRLHADAVARDKDGGVKEVGRKDGCARVREWLLLRINGRCWQHGCERRSITRDNVPGLRSFPIWDIDSLKDEFGWIEDVKRQYSVVLKEVLSLRDNACAHFQPYRDPVSNSTGASEESATERPKEVLADDGVGVEATDRGQWNVLYFLLNHKKFDENCAACPKTVHLIEHILPRSYSHAFVSALTPGSHIKAHCGPSNRMLRVWLPLCGMEGCRMRVGDRIVEPKEGEVLVWDHSYNHEVWHDGPSTRLVLIADIWHPDLSDEEIKFLKVLQTSRLKAGRLMLEQSQKNATDKEGAGVYDESYFGIVERAKGLLTSDDWWILNEEQKYLSAVGN